MKVYMVGSHSVGKTTLARYVSKTHNLPMIGEVARVVLSEKEVQLDALRYDLDQVDDYQRQVFHRQMEQESKYPSFVSDRSFIDCLSYAAQHGRIVSELIRQPQIADYLQVLRQKDTHIFLVRPSRATLKADGVRESLNWDGVVAIDSMIKFCLHMWDLPYYPIAMDNMQERVRLVDSVLSHATNLV